MLWLCNTYSHSLHQLALVSRPHFVSISYCIALPNQSHTHLPEDRTGKLLYPSLKSVQGCYTTKDTGTDTVSGRGAKRTSALCIFEAQSF